MMKYALEFTIFTMFTWMYVYVCWSVSLSLALPMFIGLLKILAVPKIG